MVKAIEDPTATAGKATNSCEAVCSVAEKGRVSGFFEPYLSIELQFAHPISSQDGNEESFALTRITIVKCNNVHHNIKLK